MKPDNQFSRDVQHINERANEPKHWGTAVLVYGGLFFVFPWAVVGLFWVAEHTDPLVAALIVVGILLPIIGAGALYLRTHGKRTAGSA